MPPPRRAATKSAKTSGITVSPSRRKFGRQPQIRYAPTTSQTKRLGEPAHDDQGKPSARAACTTSSAVWASQPMRTPQMASRLNRGDAYATTASPYAKSAGQKRASAILLPKPFEDLRHLALQALQLRGDDQHVGKNADEDDEIRRRGVLLRRGHASSSRSSRRWASSRLPASSSW